MGYQKRGDMPAALTTRNDKAKRVTPPLIEQVRKLRDAGYSYQQIAEALRIQITTAYRAANAK
jgi:DNA invertase Pin-like site-specific DNA recombinase